MGALFVRNLHAVLSALYQDEAIGDARNVQVFNRHAAIVGGSLGAKSSACVVRCGVARARFFP